MTLAAVLKMLPLVLVLENRALGIVLNCVVYMERGTQVHKSTIH